MENKPLILLIEDDKTIRNFIRVSLEAQGYKCIDTEYGNTGVALVFSHNPEIIIVDLGLPDTDGIDVILKIRPFTKAAIIVVSARGNEREKVEALDSGADDYLTKPFSVVELLARIRVALRRFNQNNGAENDVPKKYTVEDLVIDFEKRRASVAGEEIHLTPIEFNLIALLAKHAGKVLTHKYIINEIWGSVPINDNQSLRVFMANIRRKIEKNTTEPRYILTEVGVGYRLVDE